MNETNAEQEKIERLLKQARLPEPSSQFRDQVTASARQAWDQERPDVSWRIPLWRLALSAAAAVIIISLGNHLSDLAGPRARPDDPVAASVPDAELEELAEMVYGRARSQLGTSRRRPSEDSGATLRDKMESVRRLLDEMEDNGIQAQPAPGGGRSRLLWSRPRVGSYSWVRN